MTSSSSYSCSDLHRFYRNDFFFGFVKDGFEVLSEGEQRRRLNDLELVNIQQTVRDLRNEQTGRRRMDLFPWQRQHMTHAHKLQPNSKCNCHQIRFPQLQSTSVTESLPLSTCLCLCHCIIASLSPLQSFLCPCLCILASLFAPLL